ncbi:hypothetical protein [Spirosoma areae]
MPFFDLHCHPSFKSALLNDDVTACPNPVIAVDIQLNVPFSSCVEKLVGNSLDSQSSFGQIQGGSLVVVSFLAFERVYAFVSDLSKIKNLGATILANMRHQTEGYHQLMTARDMAHFRAFATRKVGLRQYKLLKTITEYPSEPDPEIIYVIASVEGGHNFYTRPKLADQEAHPQEIVNRLVTWKQQSATDPDQFPRLLYITLAHHGQNALTNHAWAIPVRFATNTVDVGSFDPTGNGLSAVGEQFLRIALRENQTEKRILVDVKHLSLAARKQVYALMQRDFPGVPILATHMGVAGTSWEQPPISDIRSPADRPRNFIISYNKLGGFLRRIPPDATNAGLTRIPFNPWSINLYDEDIVQIMRSGGLIGVSLDRRIIGATVAQVGIEDERFSKADIPPTWQSGQPNPVSFYPPTPLPHEFSGNQSLAIQDMWAFCQSVVHIVLITELAKGNPPGDTQVPATLDPWAHVCLGSDYDGLITALKKSPSAEHLPSLFGQEMKKFLAIMVDHLNTHPIFSNPIQLPDDVIEKLSFSNGVDFLRAHFV